MWTKTKEVIGMLIDGMLKKKLLRAMYHLGVVEKIECNIIQGRIINDKHGSNEVQCKF